MIAIDVVIPVYNGAKFIGQAIDSVFAQTYKPSNLYVVNDGSTDQTEEVIEASFCKAPDGIVCKHIRKPNGGVSSARNAGIAAGASPWIAFLDADDLWHPEKLAEQVRVIETSAFQDLGVVYCGFHLIGPTGAALGRQGAVLPQPKNRGYILMPMYQGVAVTGSDSSVVVARRCFERVGGFDESLKACEDWDEWLRIAEAFAYDFVPRDLVSIRVHAENMQKDALLMLKHDLAVLRKTCARCPKDLQDIRRGFLLKLSGVPFGSVLSMALNREVAFQYYVEERRWLFPNVLARSTFVVSAFTRKFLRKIRERLM